jgi:hypothetical protein
MKILIIIALCYTTVGTVNGQSSGQNFSRSMRYVSDTLAAEEDDVVFFQGLLFSAYTGVAFPTLVDTNSITCKVVYASMNVRELTLELQDIKKPLKKTIKSIGSIVTAGNHLFVQTNTGDVFLGKLPDLPKPENTIICSLIERDTYISQYFPINNNLAGIIDFGMGKLGNKERGIVGVLSAKGPTKKEWSYPTKNGQILNSKHPYLQICADSTHIYYIDAITYQIFRRTASLDDEPFHEVGKGVLRPYAVEFYKVFDTLRSVPDSRKMLKALGEEDALDGERITSCFIHNGYLFVCKFPYESRAKKAYERYWDVWSIAQSGLRLVASNLTDHTLDERPSTLDDNWVGGEQFAPISIGDYVYSVSLFNAGDNIRSGKSPKASTDDMISSMAGSDLYQFYLVRRRLDTSLFAK